LGKLGYKKRIEIMNPLLPGLIGKKMSSSIEGTKIDLIDSSKKIKKKINSADCVEGNPDNGLMSFLKNVLMIIKEDKKEKFVIERPEKFGGNLEYINYSEIEEDFISKKLHPLDLKNGVSAEIINLLSLVEENREELEKLSSEAYEK
jgi:tyrosyl-tRNA synthetase